MVSRPLVGRHRASAGVQHEEAPGPERALCVAGREAGLPDERGVLVPERRGDGDAGDRRPGLPVGLRRRPDLREHAAGTPIASSSSGSQSSVSQVHQQRPAGVGHVGDVAAAQVPDQPRVDRAEQNLAGLGALAQSRDPIEQPADLRAREVRGHAAARSSPGTGPGRTRARAPGTAGRSACPAS